MVSLGVSSIVGDGIEEVDAVEVDTLRFDLDIAGVRLRARGAGANNDGGRKDSNSISLWNAYRTETSMSV